MPEATGGVPLPSPSALRPMKARSDSLPIGEAWSYEVKWDGMRILAFLDHGSLELTTANGLAATARFPELSGLATTLDQHAAVLDGEVVAIDEDGRPSFARLQRRMHVSRPEHATRLIDEVPVTYLVFDLLYLDGHGLTGHTFRERRTLLEALVEPGPHWQVSRSYEDGGGLMEAMRVQGLEGVVAKRWDSPYETGRRSRGWIKAKVRPQQELVVGGWLGGEGSRRARIGSLLVGYHDSAGALHYAGRVGSGLTEDEIDRLGTRLRALHVDVSPFEPSPPRDVDRHARYVEPRVVIEVAFAEWTADGRLRHPVYLGERTDVDPTTVPREPA